MPSWRSYLAAAAALVILVGGGLALRGSELRYEQGRFAFRLGRAPESAAFADALAAQDARHRREMDALRASVAAASRSEEDALRRVHRMIEESEARQAARVTAGLTRLEERTEARRQYDLAQVYGELILQPLPPNAIYVSSTDDGSVVPLFLQRIGGLRTDVKLVHGEFVGLDWYDRRLERDYGVKKAQIQELAGKVNPQQLTVTAVANANVAPGKPVFSERPPDPRGLRPGLAQVPAGVLWKTAVEEEAKPDLSVPRVDPFAIARQRRRARGIFMRHTSKGMVAQFEPYENRLIGLLVQAKLRETEQLLAARSPQVLKIYENARVLDPSLEVDAIFQYNYGLALYQVNQMAPAKDAFEKVLQLEPLPARETMSHFYLAEIARASRLPEVAQKHYARALEINGAEPLMMKTIRIRAGQ